MLSSAAELGHVVLVKLLLNHSVVGLNSSDAYGRTPLYYATTRGRKAVMEILLAADEVTPNAKTNSSQTLLLRSTQLRYEELAKLLVEAGVPPDSKDAFR